MNLIDKVLAKLGYISKKDYNWGQLFLTAKQMGLIGGSKVLTPYSQVPSVYKAVKAIADNVPQAELVFKDWESEKEIYPKDLIKLFDKPNPLMSGNDFIQAVVGFYALYGETFIVKQASVGQATGKNKLPVELWTFSPTRFKEEKDKDGNLVAWRYGNTRFELDEVIHIKDFNPYNLLRGLAPIQPAKDLIDIDYQSLVYNKAFFDNNAIPPYYLSTDKPLTDKQRTQLQEWYNKHYKGASKAFKMAVLESGIEPKTVGNSHKDMDFIEQKKFTREELLGIWRVPKALFNITDDLNYATFVGQMKVFWLYGIAPILRKIESGLNSYLIEPFDTKIYCEFDYSNAPAFQEDFKEKVLTAKELFAMGFTGNEINEKLQLGFENKPWRDKWWIPFSMLPAGEEKELPKEGDPEKSIKGVMDGLIWKNFLNRHIQLEGKFASTLSKYFYEQRKRVLDNISKKDAQPIVVTIDWAKENDQLIKQAMPYVLAGIEEGVVFAKDLTEVEVDPEVVKTIISSYLTVKLEDIKTINETVKRHLSEAIAEGMTAGESISQITDRVRGVYNEAGNRARTIARTETTGALNGGNFLYLAEAGATHKKWITAGDEAVRSTHNSLNGQVVRLTDRFSNGLMFPGDKGAASEVINCRCTLVAVFRKENV